MKRKAICLLSTALLMQSCALHEKTLTIDAQRKNLAKNTKGRGFGPQSPRDIDQKSGSNTIYFSDAPSVEKMNLCNIHFHKGAEHKGGEFNTYIGDGDGHGYGSGYKYSGLLTAQESKPFSRAICPSKHGGLSAGDTIEVHYVYSTNQLNQVHRLVRV